MRTTISLDDGLGKAARRQAKAEGLSLSGFIARALRDRLNSRPARRVPRFRLVTVGGGGPHSGVDPDKSSQLLLNDDEPAFTVRKRG